MRYPKIKALQQLLVVCWLLLGARHVLGQAPAIAAQPIPTGKIAWSDFTGSPEASSPYWAHTEWRVTYSYKTVGFSQDVVKIDAQAQALLKATSWVRPDRVSETLLVHEQGHFNFALLVAARFKKAAATAVFTRANYAQQVHDLFEGILSEVKQLEIQYDAETNHMRNKEAQLAWNKQFEELLQVAE